MSTIVINKTVNTIQVSAKKGQTFKMLQEFANSFKIEINGKARMISKKVSSIIVEEKKEKPGIIASIVKHLRSGSYTKEMLLDLLETEFPERERTAMKRTLDCQLGFGLKSARIEAEQKITLLVERVSKKSVFFSIA